MLQLAGLDAIPRAERALHLPALDAVVVADLHWGKAAAFRAAAVPVPRGTTTDDLARLDALLAATSARHLVVLGDLFHARAGKARDTVAQLDAWRARQHTLGITLVRGNHDHAAGDPPASLGITCVDAPAALGPFVLRHHPSDEPSGPGYELAGHLHPSIRLNAAHDRVVAPCFHLRPHGMILPAFGSFTGGGAIEVRAGDRVLVIADEEVVEVPVVERPTPRRSPRRVLHDGRL